MLSKIVLLCITFGTGACTVSDPYVVNGAIGGLGGATIGAGTGALIGHLIKNGDVGASALLGTAIGLPTGIAAGVAYQSYKENKVINGNNDIIESNAKILRNRNDQIQKLREELIDESFRIEPDDSNPQFIYTGATIGTYH